MVARLKLKGIDGRAPLGLGSPPSNETAHLRENVSTYAGLGNPPHSETAHMNMHNSSLRSAARPVSAMMIAMM